MAVFKGDNSTVTLVKEDNGYAKPPTTYAGGKLLQNNDGTFNPTRNALESEARTPASELAGVRLGNKQVAATYPVELDPFNYNHLLESVFYNDFLTTGVEQVLTGVNISATNSYNFKVVVSSAEQSALVATIGNAYRISGISNGSYTQLEGVVILIAKTGASLTFMNPDQKLGTIAAVATDITITPVANLRSGKSLKSFNAEELIFSEDGLETARFMTAGAICSGVSIDLPSEGLITGSFSFLGSNYLSGKNYSKYDATLVDDTTAHTAPEDHVKYDPMVLQDGAIISGNSETLCQWLSGSINIENGTQTFFTGCSFEAAGSFSGAFRVNVTMEVLFESEDDFIAFENEESLNMMLRLKDRTTDQCLVLYIPSLARTAYTKANGKGLVTASITATAVVSPDAVNSMIIGQYSL